MFSSVHQSFTDAPAIRPMPIKTDPLDSTDAPQQPDTQQPPDQPDHPMPDPRPPTPPDESLIIPCRQHHAVCHQTVQWILHYRRTTSLAEEMQRLNGKNSPFHPQVDSIDWGLMSLCRHSRNHLSQFFRLSWYLHHLRFLQIPKQKMKILNCQHLRKKKQEEEEAEDWEEEEESR